MCDGMRKKRQFIIKQAGLLFQTFRQFQNVRICSSCTLSFKIYLNFLPITRARARIADKITLYQSIKTMRSMRWAYHNSGGLPRACARVLHRKIRAIYKLPRACARIGRKIHHQTYRSTTVIQPYANGMRMICKRYENI